MHRHIDEGQSRRCQIRIQSHLYIEADNEAGIGAGIEAEKRQE